jgi:hypothetical protein
MSLFNNINSSILAQNGFSSSGFIQSALGGIGNAVSDTLGLGNTQLGGIISGGIQNAGMGEIQKLANGVDVGLFSKIDSGLGVAGQILDGNYSGAAVSLIKSNLLNDVLPSSINGLLKQEAYWLTPTPLCGGVSPAEYFELYKEYNDIEYDRKNLFVIEISSNLGDVSKRFNMLAIECDYEPQTVSGDKVDMGSCFVDLVKKGEPTELKITTYDTKDGFIKTWFKNHFATTVHSDGTVGVPNDYAINIKIVHSVIKTDWITNDYQDEGKFRVTNMSISRSRRADEFAELSLGFTQLDSFMWL